MTAGPLADDDVVISAAAACCSLGSGRGRILDAMLEGRVAIEQAPAIEGVFSDDLDRVAKAAQAEPLTAGESDRAETMIGGIVRSALEEAGLQPEALGDLRSNGARVETIFGTTLGGMRHLGRGMRDQSNAEFARTLTGTVNRDALAGTGLPLGGTTISAACASGVSSLSLGATALLLDEADLVVAVAYDPISEFAYAGFSCLRLVAGGPLRPFTADREGMRVGEGCGVFVLERADHARRRGRTPIARILGWGAASDAHHLTQPAPDGRGAARAIESAVVARPDVIVAHATSTPANDAAEYGALSTVFGEDLRRIPVTAFKSRIGHTLAAAGSVELAVLIAAMERGVLPSTANARPDHEAFPDLDLVLEPRELQLDRGLAVSLGFGGADAAISIESVGASKPTVAAPPVHETEEVVLTGVGVLMPDGTTGSESGEWSLDDEKLAGLDDPRAVRRLARFSRLVRAVGRLAIEDAGLEADQVRSAAAFVGSRFGAAQYTLDYYDELIREGLGAGNPLYFAESVPNIGSAQLSLGLGIEGFTLTSFGTRLSGLEAMHLARRHLASGQADRAIVIAAEEVHPMVRSILRRLGLLDDRPCAECAVAFVLERASAAADCGRTSAPRLASTSLVWPEGIGWRAAGDAIRDLLPEDGSEFRICGADNGSGGSGDRLVQRVAGDIGAMTEDSIETHSVQPMLEIASLISKSGIGTVLARDEAGGCGSASLKSI